MKGFLLRLECHRHSLGKVVFACALAATTLAVLEGYWPLALFACAIVLCGVMAVGEGRHPFFSASH